MKNARWSKNSKIWAVSFDRVFIWSMIALLSLLAVSTSMSGQIATAGLTMAAGLAN